MSSKKQKILAASAASVLASGAYSLPRPAQAEARAAAPAATEAELILPALADAPEADAAPAPPRFPSIDAFARGRSSVLQRALYCALGAGFLAMAAGFAAQILGR